jgi:hypothetical protein
MKDGFKKLIVHTMYSLILLGGRPTKCSWMLCFVLLRLRNIVGDDFFDWR